MTPCCTVCFPFVKPTLYQDSCGARSTTAAARPAGSGPQEARVPTEYVPIALRPSNIRLVTNRRNQR